MESKFERFFYRRCAFDSKKWLRNMSRLLCIRQNNAFYSNVIEEMKFKYY
jgi:hypothetical protein